jgi:serine protease Do
MPLGTANDLMVGETVIAIGNAFGYDHTVSVGIVSALHRDVTLNKEISYKDLIQTDAPINPGNSGGPLLNIRGELIGINVAIRAGAQGIGFAIPVDAMMRVTADLLSGSRRGGPSLGLGTRDGVTTNETRGPDRELLVESLDPNGPAARAGLKRGDVIVRADGKEVFSRLDLERHLNERVAGDSASLEVRRDGKVQQLKVAFESSFRPNPEAVEMAWRKLGLRLNRADIDTISKANKQLNGGLLVEEVRAESAASRAGIQRGDILVGLHQWEMLNFDNVVFVLTHPDLESFLPLRFYLVRGGQVNRGWLQSMD